MAKATGWVQPHGFFAPPAAKGVGGEVIHYTGGGLPDIFLANLQGTDRPWQQQAGNGYRL